MTLRYEDVLTFWFDEAGPELWFKKSDEFDALCRTRFLPSLEAASAGECWHWRKTPAGRCAEIILLDQFSRNVFRDSPRAFAQDAMALTLAQVAVANGDDLHMTPDERYFTYMPYMHSESLRVHEEAMRLFTALGHSKALQFQKAHRDVIETYGRYPGRNAALGRESTEAERKYLSTTRGF